MSGRLLSIAAAIVIAMSSGAALACPGAKAKSADGSSNPASSQVRGG